MELRTEREKKNIINNSNNNIELITHLNTTFQSGRFHLMRQLLLRKFFLNIRYPPFGAISVRYLQIWFYNVTNLQSFFRVFKTIYEEEEEYEAFKIICLEYLITCCVSQWGAANCAYDIAEMFFYSTWTANKKTSCCAFMPSPHTHTHTHKSTFHICALPIFPLFFAPFSLSNHQKSSLLSSVKPISG